LTTPKVNENPELTLLYLRLSSLVKALLRLA
jgi:hypothetical protein